MPFKLHSKGRRHIPRQRHRVTNWREYDASRLCCMEALDEAFGRYRGFDHAIRTYPAGASSFIGIVNLSVRCVSACKIDPLRGVIGVQN